MDVSIHTRDRSIATSADRLKIDNSAVVRIKFIGEPDRHCNPTDDGITIFANDRADALRIAQGLREAADKLEACYPLTMETATMQERRESVARVYEETRPILCVRCGVVDDFPNSELSQRDGHWRCRTCAAAVEQEAADESHAEDVAEAMSNNPREEA